MSLRFPFFVCFLCVFLINQSNGVIEPSKATLVYDEQPCNAFGGKCTEAEMDCPAGTRITAKGLCPSQQHRGVECCHSVLRKINTCRSHGGECMDRCPENLTYKNADDCNIKNKICCILV